ncbi:MAG: TRM11 family SAM-dependent methyltransferase [Thermoplasmataceae archaeon]
MVNHSREKSPSLISENGRTALPEEAISILNEKLPGIIIQTDILSLRKSATELLAQMYKTPSSVSNPVNPSRLISREVVMAELNQVTASRTAERAVYYAKRLYRSLNRTRTGRVNDIDLSRWKEYDDIITDSLWIEKGRDRSSGHSAWYWGNFIPMIPRQMMKRYTKKGDWVLDPFMGSGTTLIESRRLGRNAVGVDLNPETVTRATGIIDATENPFQVSTKSFAGDSLAIDYQRIMEENDIGNFQLVILHPPYQDIIRFSESPDDLSNIEDTGTFIRKIGELSEKMREVLQEDRYLVLVIGDKYSKGVHIPLGFYCMNEIMQRGFLLRSMVVKNFDTTRGKRSSEQLWRYRALSGGFYVFKHEYIFIFSRE